MTAVAGWTSAQQNLTGDGEPVRVGVGLVTANTFDGARRRAAAGAGHHRRRRIGPTPRRSPCWATGCGRTRYGGDPGIVGRRVLLNDVPVEVVGVMPRGFRLPTDFTEDAAEPTELWRPLQIDEANAERGSHGYFGAAMLAPGPDGGHRHRRAAVAHRRDDRAGPLSRRDALLGLRHRPRRRDPRRHPAGAVAADGRRRVPAAHRLRQRRQPAAGPRRRARCARWRCAPRSARPPIAWCGSCSPRASSWRWSAPVLGLAVAAAGLRVLVALDPTSLPPLTPLAVDWTWSASRWSSRWSTTLLFGLVPALRTLRVNLVESLREGIAAGHRRRRPPARCAARWSWPRWRWPSSWSSAPA